MMDRIANPVGDPLRALFGSRFALPLLGILALSVALNAQPAVAQSKEGMEAQSQKNIETQAQQSGSTAPARDDPVLRVCADPSGLPQSNDRGEGYENKIAEALAHEIGRA